jgi:dethiobiotin synthetase
MRKVIFITGIGTDIGKSYATGYLAKQYLNQGYSVITQKFIQTGNNGISEDIQLHRKIMGIDLLPEDLNGTTCPIVLSYPASPHLAAQIDNIDIDLDKIQQATATLRKKYEVTLIEGAGGIMTPIAPGYTTLNYIKMQKLSIIVVTTPQLGSINHTLLTLEMCRYSNIKVAGLVYNKFNVEDELICDDTLRYIKNYIARRFSNVQIYECENIQI